MVGTTATVAFITIESKKRVLYVANVGDSSAVLVNNEGIQKLTYDHRATDPEEAKRIK